MFTLLLYLVILAALLAFAVTAIAYLASTVFRMWGVETPSDWLREAWLRITCGTVRRKFLRSIVAQVEVLPSRARRAFPALLASVSVDDLTRLVSDGDLDRLAADAADLYACHARREGWKVDTTPVVVVVVDDLLRPRTFRVRPISAREALEHHKDRASRADRPADRVRTPRRGRTVPYVPTVPLDDPGPTAPVDPADAVTVPATRRLVIDDANRGRHVVTADLASIGRGHDCAVKVEAQGVSRVHAQVYLQGGSWWVRDTNSLNGTLLDDKQIKGKGPRPLTKGSRLEIGGSEGTRLLVTAALA